MGTAHRNIRKINIKNKRKMQLNLLFTIIEGGDDYLPAPTIMPTTKFQTSNARD